MTLKRKLLAKMSGLVLVLLLGACSNDGIVGAGGYVLYMAEAQGIAHADSVLYAVNPNTGKTKAIGSIGYAVTGLAFAPDGTLYGATATTNSGDETARSNQIIKISPSNGKGTIVGATNEPGVASSGVNGTSHYAMPDITFKGKTLYGWTEDSDDLVTINTSTGAVKTIGTGESSSGTGLVYSDKDGKMYMHEGLNFWQVSLTDGTLGAVSALTGLSGHLGGLSLAYCGDTLYVTGTQGWNNGSDNGAAEFGTVDIVSGVFTAIAELPSIQAVDAVACKKAGA